MSTQRVPCQNPEAHGVKSHVAGSAAAIACIQTGGRSTKLSHISTPPRQTIKGNNIGNVGIMTNISEDSLNWGKSVIKRDTPQTVASVIETVANNSYIKTNFKDTARPFVSLVHDPDYEDDFGSNALLPDPYDLGTTYDEPNDQAKRIIESDPAPEFFDALATEMDSDPDTVANAYRVIQGYLSDPDKAKVYAAGCLRSEYLDRKDQIAVINDEIQSLSDIFSKDIDDGTLVEKHGIEFSDGAGIQFTPARKFQYDDAVPGKNADGTTKQGTLTDDEYKSIIKEWVPKYKPLKEVEKILGDKADAYIEFGSTALSVK